MKRYFIPLLLLLSVPLWAGNIPTPFYVDTAGNDSNTGLATDNAWATVAKVNAFSRTNKANYTESFDSWLDVGAVTVSSDNSISPDGALTTDNIIVAAVNRGKQIIAAATPATSKTWTASAWVSSDTACTMTMTIGSDGVRRILDSQLTITTTPTRRTITTTADNTDIGNVNMWVWRNNGTTDNCTSISAWGAQLEEASVETPYVPVPETTPVTASFQPGDNVLFKRGETWAETLTVPSSGTSGAHITYGAYSTGVYPKITGGLDENSKTYVDYGAETITFTDIAGTGTSTIYTSNAVMYEGIDNQVAVSISGTGCTYSLNGGAYAASADNVIVNDNVTVRGTSSGSFSTGVPCTLTMGSVSDVYTMTTRAEPANWRRLPNFPEYPTFPTWH